MIGSVIPTTVAARSWRLSGGARLRSIHGKTVGQASPGTSYRSSGVGTRKRHYLALGLANWICTLSPKRMVLGGGVMQQQWLFPLIRAEFIRLLNGYVRSKELIENVDRRHSDLRPISTHLPESVIIGCVANIQVCEKCDFT